MIRSAMILSALMPLAAQAQVVKPHPLQVSATQMVAPQVKSPAVRTTTVIKQLVHPWSLAFKPDGGMLITERGGKLLRFEKGSLMPTPVMGLPKDIYVSGQAGLFEVLPALDFEKSRTIYLSYATRKEGGTVLRVVRARLNEDKGLPKLANIKTIFESTPPIKDDKNLGGRLMPMADGSILVSVGDFFDQDKAQLGASTLGKVVRVNTDGTVPDNNPYVGREGVRPEIYTLGNRNIQGWAINPRDGNIWMNEHGPKGGDEVNVLRQGANYGWPKVTYGIDYSGKTISQQVEGAGFTAPVLHWVPSIAPSGMAFYTGTQIKAWEGDAFVGALAGKQLRRLELDAGGKVTGEEALLTDLDERIREVRMGPDGYLYLLTDAKDGKLLRVEPK